MIVILIKKKIYITLYLKKIINNETWSNYFVKNGYNIKLRN